MAAATDPSPLAQYTAFQRDLLRVVERLESEQNQSPYGLRIKRALESAWDEEVNRGRLYPNLDDLADAGFLEVGQRDRRTNTYALTERGRQALDADRAWRSA